MTPNPQQRSVRLVEIDELARQNCKIKDIDRVERIINEIVKGGPDKLQIVTDFDFTLTKQVTDDGKPVQSSFGMFNKCKSVPKSFLEKSNELYQTYHPIEICPQLSQDEKKKPMLEWWTKSAGIFKGFKFDPKEIDEIAKLYGHSLRNGTHDLVKLTNQLQVPVLVFSAGLGDTICAVLKNEQVLLPNIKVVSNYINYDNDGCVDGFCPEFPLIYTFNKNESVLEGTEYYEKVKHRKNVILMGDSLADSDMAEGVQSPNILKIGFLFDHPEKNLYKYMETFDIVLIDDQTMDVPRKILSLVQYND